jgi:hypothetical protein
MNTETVNIEPIEPPEVKKVIRDGQVAILISPGYGAGWHTWNADKEWILYDPYLVDLVEKLSTPEFLDQGPAGPRALFEDIVVEIESYCNNKDPDGYYGGARDLVVKWLPVGTKFYIEEYDGSESLINEDKLIWLTA